MNIQDEINTGRLVVDFEKPQVFIQQELYQEMLDTSMIPYALRAIRVAAWKKWLIKLLAFFDHAKYEQMVTELQFKFYLRRMLEYVNENRIHVLGMNPDSMVNKLDFVVTPFFEKATYVGVYLHEDDRFYMRPVIEN